MAELMTYGNARDPSNAVKAFVECWHPIETAPRDAELLLLYMRGDKYPRTGWFDEEGGHWVGYDADGEWPFYPGHWMRLPEPPK